MHGTARNQQKQPGLPSRSLAEGIPNATERRWGAQALLQGGSALVSHPLSKPEADQPRQTCSGAEATPSLSASFLNPAIAHGTGSFTPDHSKSRVQTPFRRTPTQRPKLIR